MIKSPASPDPPPPTQPSQLYQTILKDKLQFTGTWVEGFESWAKEVGLSLNPQFFPYLRWQ